MVKNIIQYSAILITCFLASCTKKELVSQEEIDEAERLRFAQEKIENALAKGKKYYEQGQYLKSEEQLYSPIIWESENNEIISKALKYLAFIYCVNDMQITCTQAFERALQFDSNFELSSGERGHPLWDPAFQSARYTHLCLAKKNLKNANKYESLCN